MHEMSLCASVVDVLEEQARVQDYSRVKTVWLEVGELAGVELDDFLQGIAALPGAAADRIKNVPPSGGISGPREGEE